MSNVIDFLTNMESDFEVTSDANLESALLQEGLSEEIATAIIEKDQKELERLLGLKHTVSCIVVPAEDDEEGDDGDSEEEKRVA